MTKTETTQHTPGPWWATLSGPGPTWEIRGPGGLLIARVMGSHDCDLGQPHPETTSRNARLIAAAPELLEACKRTYRGLEDEPGAERLRALVANAITKAEGGGA